MMTTPAIGLSHQWTDVYDALTGPMVKLSNCHDQTWSAMSPFLPLQGWEGTITFNRNQLKQELKNYLSSTSSALSSCCNAMFTWNIKMRINSVVDHRQTSLLLSLLDAKGTHGKDLPVVGWKNWTLIGSCWNVKYVVSFVCNFYYLIDFNVQYCIKLCKLSFIWDVLKLGLFWI